ncbi:MAG: hypothetical protein ACN4GR_01680 [Arenicellales bacterium]
MKEQESILLVANWKIRRNGKVIRPHGEFETDDFDEAETLIDRGAASHVEVADDPAPAADPDPVVDPAPATNVEPTAEERSERIKVALAEMLKEDPEQKNEMLWTKSRNPRNKAVDANVDFDAKNEEVLAVWESMKGSESNA